MLVGISEFTDVLVPFGRGGGALSVRQTISEFPDVFAHTVSSEGAKTIRPSGLVSISRTGRQSKTLPRTSQHEEGQAKSGGQVSHRRIVTGNVGNEESGYPGVEPGSYDEIPVILVR